ncbi:MAG: hypothetical protein Q7I97_09505 [Thermovirgaceae bacterium]|nr:hypothetical protein [Thermovirgaceae bacterium]
MTERSKHQNDEFPVLEGIPGRVFFEHSGALNMLVASDTTLLASVDAAFYIFREKELVI